jgi:hypothetical protein
MAYVTFFKDWVFFTFQNNYFRAFDALNFR